MSNWFYRLAVKAFLPLVILPLCLAAKAQGASFNCAKAKTEVEKIICSDSDLSKLDKEMAVTYKAALQDQQQADAVRQAQKQWLKERNSCIDAGCLKKTYITRLQGLPGPVAEGKPAPSSGDATGRQPVPPQAGKKPRYGHCVES